MFKKTIGCLIVGMLSGSIIGAAAEEMPKPNAKELWNYISKVSPYTEWSFWPDHPGMKDGRAPDAPKHKIFVNKQGLDSTGTPVQYGTIQVKELHGLKEELKGITVMYKVKGYNPKAGDWFWARYSKEGIPVKAGRLRECINCHATRAANDFIVVHEFSTPDWPGFSRLEAPSPQK